MVQISEGHKAVCGDRQREELNPELERGTRERQSCTLRGGFCPRDRAPRGRVVLSRRLVHKCGATIPRLTTVPISSSCFTKTLLSSWWCEDPRSDPGHIKAPPMWLDILACQGSGGRQSMGSARTLLSLRTSATRRRRGATLQSNCWASGKTEKTMQTSLQATITPRPTANANRRR